MHEKHRERVRSRFLENGSDAFSDKNILEFLLFFSLPRVDTNPVASELLNNFGNLKNIFSADINDLWKIKGMGLSSSVLIKLVGEISGRLNHSSVSSDDNELNILKETFFDVENESFYIFASDGSHRITDIKKCISCGCFDNVEISTDGFLESAINLGCEEIIFAHNHPDGIVAPSKEDIDNTVILIDLLSRNGIRTIDHYIYADGDYLRLSDTEKYKDLFS